jgi:hypothetical protein
MADGTAEPRVPVPELKRLLAEAFAGTPAPPDVCTLGRPALQLGSRVLRAASANVNPLVVETAAALDGFYAIVAEELYHPPAGPLPQQQQQQQQGQQQQQEEAATAGAAAGARLGPGDLPEDAPGEVEPAVTWGVDPSTVGPEWTEVVMFFNRVLRIALQLVVQLGIHPIVAL